MLSIRKLRQHITAVPSSASLSLFSITKCTAGKSDKWRWHGFSNSRCQVQSSNLSNLNIQAMGSEFRDGLPRQLQSFSTMAGTVLVQAQDPGKLCMELESAIEERRLDDSWNLFEQHMQMDGFPRKSIVNMLLSCYAESLDLQYLDKAFGVVEKAFEGGKQNLFEKQSLLYLSYSLANCGLPVPASTIMRKLVEMEAFPSVTAWSAVAGHMSQTAPGAYLAAELILEIGYLFQNGRIDPRKKSNAPLIAMKPNTNTFNVVLAGCLLSGTTRKAEQLLDMMPRIGIKADVNLLVIMAQIYERNGRREDLKKLQRHISEANSISDIQLRQFYSSLFTCHLKFGDLDTASHMVLEMLRKAKEARNSLASATLTLRTPGYESFPNRSVSGKNLSQGTSDVSKLSSSSRSLSLSYEEFYRDKNFVKLESEVKQILNSLLRRLQVQIELVTTEHGILQPTENIYVKLVKAFLETGKTKKLAEFLIKAEKEESPVSPEDSASVQVINSCISLGWLDQAHDLLDEMRLAGVRTGSSVYASLLKAYIKAKRQAEVTALLRDVRNAGVQLDSSCYDALIESRLLQEDTQGALHLFKEMKEAKLPRGHNEKLELLVKGCADGGEAKLMAKLLQEIKEGQTVDCGLHDWNNVIHFFSKKRLMQDAEKALKKMRSLGHVPNAQTFHSMVTGYAAIGGNYIEVTELWGEMKSIASATSMKFDQELLDSVLYTFVRGGFFTRANEVVELMEKGNMFIDKYKYRTLFLKYHKTLCKGKAPKFQTEAQSKKREAVLAFKKWIGLF